MIKKSFLTLSLFIFLNFLVFSFVDLFYFWVMVEVMNIIFIFLIFKYEKSSTSFIMMFYYFLLQSLVSLIFLTGMITSNSHSELIIFLSILFKMGLFPFHSWVFFISKSFSSTIMFMFLIFAKLSQFVYFYYYEFFSSFLDFFFILNIFVGSILLFYSKNLKFLVVSSSLVMFFWILNNMFMSLWFFVLNYIYYGIFNFYVINSKSFKNLKFFCLAGMIFLIGLPPFNIFFMKFYVMEFLTSIYHYEFLIFLVLFSFLSLISYFKFFYHFFFFNYGLYKLSNLKNLNFFFLLPLLLFFFY